MLKRQSKNALDKQQTPFFYTPENRPNCPIIDYCIVYGLAIRSHVWLSITLSFIAGLIDLIKCVTIFNVDQLGATKSVATTNSSNIEEIMIINALTLFSGRSVFLLR